MKPTLIIADDDAQTREKLYSWLIEDFDIVAMAANGKEAVQAVRTHRPQLLVMDVVMPLLSGIDATRAIFSESRQPPVVVIVSGLTDQGVVVKALQAGAKEYLHKPVTEDRLKSVLWNLLKSAA